MKSGAPAWQRQLLEGQVIPAVPLMLTEDGSWSPRHQRALVRYYLDAGAGGLAVGVHSTQFAIRDPQYNLYEPVLRLVSAEVDARGASSQFVKIAGICGETQQAQNEARFAVKAGYHAGLLGLKDLHDADEASLITHARQVADVLPVIGFYLQPAVGGRVLSYDFWRRFVEIENVCAIKIAPFNRYYTLDVVRAVLDSGRSDVALYTGNDDNILIDLLTRFVIQGRHCQIVGGLLGQWGVWTRAAVDMFGRLKSERENSAVSQEWLTWNAALTDANAAIFDAAHSFQGCIPGILEVLRRQGLAPSTRCLNPDECLSPGQSEAITRVTQAYPQLTDDEFVARNLSRWLTD